MVVDGNMVFAGGVTAGIDGALRIATYLRGEEVAQGIQLYMQYAPKPPFNAGVPETPPARVLAKARDAVGAITARREQTARRMAKRLALPQ